MVVALSKMNPIRNLIQLIVYIRWVKDARSTYVCAMQIPTPVQLANAVSLSFLDED